MKKFIPTIFFITLGLVALVWAYSFYAKATNLVQNGGKATGTVTLVMGVPGNRRTYRPIIDFTAADGSTVKFTSDFAENPPQFQVGDKAEVVYDKNNPKDAEVNQWPNLYYHAFTASVIAMILLCFGILDLTIGIKLRSKKSPSK